MGLDPPFAALAMHRGAVKVSHSIHMCEVALMRDVQQHPHACQVKVSHMHACGGCRSCHRGEKLT